MLGSLHDAEDALQDTLLRAWRGLAGFAGRRPRPWLYAIATNVCLDAGARRRRRILPMDHGPPAAPGADPGAPLEASVWIEPYPDGEVGIGDGRLSPEARYERRESVELAFIAALQHLPPRGRAVLILREVLGFSARETAEALDSTTASVNSALQRARKAIDERLPAASQQATLRALGDDGVRDLVERFIDAFERADVDAIVALLADDAEFAMPPVRRLGPRARRPSPSPGSCRAARPTASATSRRAPTGRSPWAPTRSTGRGGPTCPSRSTSSRSAAPRSRSCSRSARPRRSPASACRPR